jgi:DNA repair photolyase
MIRPKPLMELLRKNLRQRRSTAMAETSIEWTDATWNPVAGCAVISAGCTNCYAMQMAARLEAMGSEKYRGLTRRSGKRAVCPYQRRANSFFRVSLSGAKTSHR